MVTKRKNEFSEIVFRKKLKTPNEGKILPFFKF